ncbi:MAG: hypothetical protein KY395_02195 [Actinobacteria bacterium]|nr:hypothetical protein [Actinomycetota bacterium]
MGAASDRGAPVNGRLRRIRDRHFDCYVDLATAAEEATDDRAAWLEVLDSEIANIRSALEWGLATGRPETAAFAASLSWYWQRSRKYAEGRQALDRALRHPNLPVTARMDALYAAGALAWDQSDPAGARERYEASRELAASAGDRHRQALAAVGIGWACFHVSLAEPAVEAFTEALTHSESLSVAEQADGLRGLAWANNLKGDNDAAVRLHQDARTLLEDAGDSDLTAHYLVETNFLVVMGRPQEALVLSEKAVALARAGEGELIFALIAREKAADALGDVELVRRAVAEGIEFTQAAGEAKWEAHFQGRLADVAMLHGDIDAARDALDRALRVLDDLDDLDRSDVGVRAGLLARRARLAEDDGDLELAEELHRQVALSYGESSPRSHAIALAAVARFLAAHDDPGGARLGLERALAEVDGVDEWAASDLTTELAIFDDDLEQALQLITNALDVYTEQGNQALPVAHRRRAALLAELGRFDESAAVLDEALAAGGATSEVVDRSRSHVDRARVRIALGDAAGARSDLLATEGVERIGWATDQLHVATTLARLALLEGRRGRALDLWSAVVDYRTANNRLPPRLSRRFEAPLSELKPRSRRRPLASRPALDRLRSLVAEEFRRILTDS